MFSFGRTIGGWGDERVRVGSLTQTRPELGAVHTCKILVLCSSIEAFVQVGNSKNLNQTSFGLEKFEFREFRQGPTDSIVSAGRDRISRWLGLLCEVNRGPTNSIPVSRQDRISRCLRRDVFQLSPREERLIQWLCMTPLNQSVIMARKFSQVLYDFGSDRLIRS